MSALVISWSRLTGGVPQARRWRRGGTPFASGPAGCRAASTSTASPPAVTEKRSRWSSSADRSRHAHLIYSHAHLIYSYDGERAMNEKGAGTVAEEHERSASGDWFSLWFVLINGGLVVIRVFLQSGSPLISRCLVGLMIAGWLGFCCVALARPRKARAARSSKPLAHRHTTDLALMALAAALLVPVALFTSAPYPEALDFIAAAVGFGLYWATLVVLDQTNRLREWPIDAYSLLWRALYVAQAYLVGLTVVLTIAEAFGMVSMPMT